MSVGLLNVSAAFTELRLSHLNLARTAGGEHGTAIIASSLHSLSCLQTLSLASLHAPPKRHATAPPGPHGACAAPRGREGRGIACTFLPTPLSVRDWGGGNGGIGDGADLDDVSAQTREGIQMLSNELSRMFSGRRLEKLNTLDLSHIPLRCSVCVLYMVCGRARAFLRGSPPVQCPAECARACGWPQT